MGNASTGAFVCVIVSPGFILLQNENFLYHLWPINFDTSSKREGLYFRFCNILGVSVTKYAKKIAKSAKYAGGGLEGIVCMESSLLYLQCRRENSL